MKNLLIKNLLLIAALTGSVSALAMDKQIIPMNTVTTPHYPQNQPYSPSMEQPRPTNTQKANDNACLAKACTCTIVGLCAPLACTMWVVDQVCCNWCCTGNDND